MKITVLWVDQEESWVTLKMVAESSFETSVSNYQQTWRHIPEYFTLPLDNFVNLLHILMNENIIQDLPPNWITSFPEVHK